MFLPSNGRGARLVLPAVAMLAATALAASCSSDDDGPASSSETTAAATESTASLTGAKSGSSP